MAISIFPSTAAEFVSNNFVIDMNDTNNNSVTLANTKQAGTYNISLDSGDTSFDIYFLDSDGALVAYSNSATIAPADLFTTVVILGVATSEQISFAYAGGVSNADGEGDEPGAGAYLESISPTDLPSIDDTATVTGGNFGADTEIKFESGATVLDAKNIVVTNSTELVVTRPDNLDADLDPWTLRAITTGVPEPTGSNANLLVDEVTAGAVPTWVTTSPLATGTVNVAYTDTLEATDADGAVTYAVTTGSLPTGLSLDSSTGVISGTPTAGGQTFTVTASDDGGNQATREFTLPILQATGGTVTSDGGFTYHTFTSTDDFEALADISNLEYLIVAGGGGGGNDQGGNNYGGLGGGGAGGLLSGTVATFTAGTSTISIGGGGSTASNGSDTAFPSIGTAIGGGGGGQVNGPEAQNGGSGGGSRAFFANFGTGTAGQGFDGGTADGEPTGGGGGGASEEGLPGLSGVAANSGDGGDGLEFSAFASATSTGDGGFYAGGGGGGKSTGSPEPSGGDGGGGDGASGEGSNATAGQTNTGGGGGGGGKDSFETARSGASGGSGIVIVRYA